MAKVLVGFVIGVLVTLSAVYLLEDDTSNLPVVNTTQPVPREKAQAVHRSTAAKPTSEESDVVDDVQRGTTPMNTDLPGEAVAIQMQSDNASAPDSQQRNSTPSASGRNIPGEIPPEIEDMLENNVDKDLQARYESDQREDSWATYMEGQLNAYFAQKPGLAQFYFSLTDCRTSVCEIHALGYGPDALTQWNAATADLVSQPWFEFNSMSMNRRNPEPDILGIVLILTKKPN